MERIKDLPQEERPRERFLNKGPSSLSTAELLAIMLRTGNASTGESALNLANRLLGLNEGGLRYLASSKVEELSQIKGIGQAKAIQVLAALELGKRLAVAQSDVKVIGSPRDVSNLLMEQMRFLDREFFQIVLLNTKNHVLGVELIAIGSLNSAIVHPREIFKVPIQRSAAAIVLVHNHPSGDPAPSPEDINVTKRLVEVGEVVGIQVLDHVIIGDNQYVSLRELGAGWEK